MNNFLNTDLYKNAEVKTYTSISALSSATGIPKRILKLAKKQNFAGFQNNNNVNFKTLKPILEASIGTLIEDESDDIGYYKKEIAKRDVELKDLQIKKLERNMIEPEAVKAMLIELSTLQSIVINNVFNELPPKLSGKSEGDIKIILDTNLQTIYDVLKNKINEL